jgi:prolyl-tRNA synthetase
LRASQAFINTLRQAPSEAEIPSHILLLRGGFIRQLTAGAYSFLPLGFRVFKRVEQIVREEMNRIGALEILMPALNPRELWEESGRWDSFAPPPMKLKDGAGREYLLGPTHEEVVTDIVRHTVRSYKQLPLTLYQIQNKFRDELRPRGGLLRSKEFSMKDAYSFHSSWGSLEATFEDMREAYCRVFTRCGLRYRIVEASAGSMGGTGTLEFMAPAENGEDTILLCDGCGYAANAEMAVRRAPADAPTAPANPPFDPAGKPEKVDTPNAHTIEAVCAMLGKRPEQLVKTMVCRASDGSFVAGLVRGDHDLNPHKLAQALGVESVELADPPEIQEITGARVGFAGPVGLTKAQIVADYDIAGMVDCVTGANADDAHLVNVNVWRDFTPAQWADIRVVGDGDACPRCDGTLRTERGIEMGHVFKLGTKYSVSMGAKYLDRDGQEKPLIMGCYGIGVSRVLSAVVEAHHDASGIIWPISIAPYDVIILLLDPDDEGARGAAEDIYADLQAEMDPLLDDRDERPGVKFKDADLIGIPIQVVIGKRGIQRGALEVRIRGREGETLAPPAEAPQRVREIARELRAEVTP